MRVKARSILVTSALCFAAVAARAQTGDPNALTPAPQAPAAASKKDAEIDKQKKRLFRLLDHARSLSKWMPNEPSFVGAVISVEDQLASVKESELAALDAYDFHFAHLEAAIARLDEHMSGVQVAVEICDPARKEDLFQMYLDALDVEGQREVNARICERLAAPELSNESLSHVCIANDLSFAAARSMRDLAVACDPSLARATADTSAARFDRLSAEVTNVQESVKTAKRDLTQAMTVVASHVAEVQSVHTDRLEASLEADQALTVRMEIERALQQASPYGWLYLPRAHGGRLEEVRAVVAETIQNVIDSGEASNNASAKLAAGDEEYKNRHYKQAYKLYSQAYAAAVGIAMTQPARDSSVDSR